MKWKESNELQKCNWLSYYCVYSIKREYKFILQNTFTKLSFFRSWTIYYKIPFIEWTRIDYLTLTVFQEELFTTTTQYQLEIRERKGRRTREGRGKRRRKESNACEWGRMVCVKGTKWPWRRRLFTIYSSFILSYLTEAEGSLFSWKWILFLASSSRTSSR